MIKPTRALPPDDDAHRSHKVPGQDKEKERVEKTREIDPEQKKKRKFHKFLEDEPTEKAEKKERKPSPYESKFYEEEEQSTKQKKELSPAQKEKTASSKQKHETKTSPQKKIKTSYKKTEKPTVPSKEKEVSSKEVPIQRTDMPMEKEVKAPTHPLHSREVKVTEKLPPHSRNNEPDLKEESIDKPEPTSKKREEAHPGFKQDPTTPLPLAPTNIPPEIQQTAAHLTNQVESFLTPEISPLFEKMVGHVLVLSAQSGIVQTEILLNSPAFSSSVFFGSTILLEKYSTAPDSFNIRLTGNPQAVTIFNENLQRLTDAFQRSNSNFRIGRLEAAYQTESPVYRRAVKRKTEDEL